MPKSYSEKERIEIMTTLKEEASKCLKLYGIKKTTVDELVKRANIPKGTFYLFYSSKELLLFEVINNWHDNIQNKLLNQVSNLNKNINADKLTDIFFDMYKMVSESGFLELLMNGEMDVLMRKLPYDKVEEHLHHDDFSMETLFSTLPSVKNKDLSAFSGAFRAIFLSMKYKREIGENCFDNALRLLIRGIVNQLLEE